MHKETIIRIENLKKHFQVNRGLLKEKKILKAVDGITFEIEKGETFGVVGESGCGKSTLGRTITRLYDATEGKIYFDGNEITKLKGKQLHPYKKKMQIIFQDPYSSLNPSMNVREILSEPLQIHTYLSGRDLELKIKESLEIVGLDATSVDKFPHEFSGGQRQRLGIARAISVEPDFILCDEPISALDVSIQAQIINKLEMIQEESGISYLFIAHDLSMVKHISHRIGVMYLGKMVEMADSASLYKEPLHPYTKGLLQSVPRIGTDSNFESILFGDLPNPVDLPSGCRFRTRCKYAKKICSEVEPTMIQIAPKRQVACHLYDK
ncbi:ABC transporter ATP-binding protein [Fusibacter ferrireducens]|uniref:ATP-binding cassette domain-containing protein n=1 Tax=Fusibacter ferrireducens TaxID=2785058 RepID=A0ABR9ZX72_9FIRM|nr:oligopeptide/dipeptide ABC transporter ATP-binding protein [Fusibacter ferrireducens]MBF4694956.1 ATP-binding cassette domain-containing protein [Fusibacter ferrireducens]